MAKHWIDPSKLRPGERLGPDFYRPDDVARVARALLGKALVTDFDGRRTAGRITEVEAYRGPDDRASHAWNNRRTPRTEVMFQEGGCAYVYLCYGIHQMFNVVSGPAGMPHAILIRAAEPLEGVEIMLERRKTGRFSPALSTGPGALAQALGLTTACTGQRLFASDTPVWIEDLGENIAETDIAAGPRIGIDYAGECAAWPWRFWLRDSPFVKRTR